MKSPFIQRSKFILTLGLLLSLVAFSNGCVGMLVDFPFQRGIRVVATLRLLYNPTGAPNVPIPNVPNTGDLTRLRDDLYGTRTGTESHFEGTTNQFGHSTYPNAITRANWHIAVGPSPSPLCLANFFDEVVPAAGAHF